MTVQTSATTGHDSIRGLGYLDLVAADAAQAVAILTQRYGFTPAGESDSARRGEVTYVLRRGEAVLLVSGAQEPGAHADAFVAEHGTRVRDIAFLVHDADRAWKKALAHGAEPGDSGEARHSISVFGAYEHTFVESPPLEETPPGATEERHGHVDHLALAVPYGKLDEWTDFYVEVLSFEVLMKETTDTGRSSMRSTVVREPDSGVTFTLVEPGAAEGDDQISEFLRHNAGPGIQHIAFGTRDIVASVDDWTGNGVRFLPVPDRYYSTLSSRVPALRAEVDRLRSRSILADRDEKGELLQIFTAPVFERPTLFFELIERRRQSSGFGAGNIKALFQAVEDEQRRRGR
ncbi:4-hydroxyphenylpyruvate dioxygenase [Streptomyces jeddahensis]|uniref:4-hydroxyphenylpyruvate dioxygenase n=1 Tax=Streptomyces jeddahensis TaxID=1716141 RepID=A0A177HEW4_9ACTN|nr:4-hydroxyphenylpyruvate dioxygenase [Streptomyces jeddahensis]OAH09472.1 4-hydroxyphenylpyruvate dioxygenase [Streptomyces jeddahensis]